MPRMFTLKIKLGNQAMQTTDDVAEALTKTARTISEGRSRSGAIVDRNGNVVGKWTLTGSTVMRSRADRRRR